MSWELVVCYLLVGVLYSDNIGFLPCCFRVDCLGRHLVFTVFEAYKNIVCLTLSLLWYRWLCLALCCCCFGLVFRFFCLIKCHFVPGLMPALRPRVLSTWTRLLYYLIYRHFSNVIDPSGHCVIYMSSFIFLLSLSFLFFFLFGDR